MKKYGLIGKTLKHSFSGKYFADKFEKEGIADSFYDLFELSTINEFPKLIQENKAELQGLNVTIPYKKEVMQFLDSLDPIAERINAVNVIKFQGSGKLKGYNSDYYGFRLSLEPWLTERSLKALILGTGGSSNAVKTVLEDLHIPYKYVSRKELTDGYTYDHIASNEHIIADHKLIINTTPLGTYPNIEDKPDLPYNQLTPSHFLYDLVYNPEVTAFLQQGVNAGAKTKNGGDMLVLQAEKSWEIWGE
ncbi:MAG: shikimate dehydrogenase [Cyclobacteriaceae bacterium]